jgi:hypothetical protein
MYPRRYRTVDGHRFLIGLTPEETAEFERIEGESTVSLDEDLPSKIDRDHASPDERRWYDLYNKHAVAYESWKQTSIT